MDSRIYMLIALPLLVAITLIRNLKLLAPFSQAANVAMFAGLGIILYYIFQSFPSIDSVQPFGPPIRYTLFLGTTLFALEAVGVVSTFSSGLTKEGLQPPPPPPPSPKKVKTLYNCKPL